MIATVYYRLPNTACSGEFKTEIALTITVCDIFSMDKHIGNKLYSGGTFLKCVVFYDSWESSSVQQSRVKYNSLEQESCPFTRLCSATNKCFHIH